MSSDLSTRQTPTLIRFSNINNMLQEMEKRFERIAKRAYQLFEQRGRGDGQDMNDWFRAESELLQPVPLQIEERENELVVRADVPGFQPGELEVSVADSHLLITGKSESKKEEKGKIVYSEQRASEISRSVDPPHAVLAENATAILKDGRMEITLPKAQTNKVAIKKISVQAA